MSSRAPAIGIDLGTTHSCVAVYAHEKIEIISNEMGYRTTPSVISFSDLEVLVGNAASYQASRNLPNTIFDVKRLIGRKFNDPKIQEDMRHWPFAVVNKDGNPKVQVFLNGVKKDFHPEEISSILLLKLKETAQIYLGKPVDSAVITVPAYFSDHQRQSTKDAGIIAGFNVLRIINEPTAAGIAYGLLTKAKRVQNILIFDLGGGTFDVSILTIKDGNFTVRATAGNTHLGGADFDNRLVDHFVAELKRKHNLSIADNEGAIRNLRTACELAKRNLSSSIETEFEVTIEKKNYVFSISRVRFNDLNKDLFQETIECVKKTLNDSNLGKGAIDEVVLVGGSTRIPKIQKLVEDFFDGKKLNQTINPDEAVAYGAAAYAAMLSGVNSKEISQIKLEDVTPISLGTMSGSDNHMNFFIPHNSAIPFTKTSRLTTLHDDQTSVGFPVYEGECSSAQDNNLLGNFTLDDVKPAKAGTEKFDVTFTIDSNGILTVSAVDLRSKNQKEITIANDGRLSKTTIVRMMEDNKTYSAENQKTAKRNLGKAELESYCINMNDFIKSGKKTEKFSFSHKEHISKQCKDALSWLEAHPKATYADYEKRLQGLQTSCNAIIGKYN